MRDQKTQTLTTFNQMNVDPRRWAPASPVSVDLSFTIPSTLPASIYDVILNLPDASPSLAVTSKMPNNIRYRILFANANGVQETSTRYNILGQVTVQ